MIADINKDYYLNEEEKGNKAKTSIVESFDGQLTV